MTWSTCVGFLYLIFVTPLMASQDNHIIPHLHMSWYSDIIPLHNPLTKVATKIGLLFDCFQRHHMEPIADDLSLRKQDTFFFEMESENCISTEL